MKKQLALLILTLSIFLTACSSTSMSMTAADGQLDLTHYDFDRQGLVSLDGDWNLFWDKLLTPADFSAAATPATDGLYTLPGSWSNIQFNEQALPRDGHLTMRLLVRLPTEVHSLGLYVPSFNTAYKVWVNGQLVASSGQVGVNAAQSQAAGYGQTVKFTTEHDTLDIIVQAANYEGVPGGPIDRFRLGPALAVTTWDYQQVALDLFVASTCFVIGVYYLSLYLLRRKEEAFIWFALFSLLIALRALLVGREVIHLLWTQVSWSLSLQLIFFTGQLSAAFFMAFVSALYPQDGWRWAGRFALASGGLIAASILLTPPSILFGPLNILYNGLVAAPIIYCAVVGLRAVRNQRPGASLLIFSSVPLILGIVIEVLGSLRIIPLYSLAGLGVLGTIAAQTLTLLRNFTQTFAAVEALSERLDLTNKAYYRFVPRELLRLIGKDDIVAVELGDQSERAMTILFSDVRGFTSLSESMSPEENFRFINQYLGNVSPIIREHHGFIDKYMGDGIMALFPEKPEDALRAAIGMCRSLSDLNAQRTQRNEAPIRIGIGLHLGNLMLGTVGEPERMDGTVIADAVNIASRLESLSKQYMATVIVSAQTLKTIEKWDTFGIRALGKIRVKGKADVTTIYEVFDGDPQPIAQLKQKTLGQFESAVNLYQTGKFTEAAEQFRQVVESNPADKTAASYVERSTAAINSILTEWDGIETLTEK